jgi:hypothetical protein
LERLALHKGRVTLQPLHPFWFPIKRKESELGHPIPAR